MALTYRRPELSSLTVSFSHFYSRFSLMANQIFLGTTYLDDNTARALHLRQIKDGTTSSQTSNKKKSYSKVIVPDQRILEIYTVYMIVFFLYNFTKLYQFKIILKCSAKMLLRRRRIVTFCTVHNKKYSLRK